MPELPEVEVTRRRIGKLLLGRKIARVVTTKPSYFFLTSPKRLQRELAGRTVKKLERHGKYILARLDSGATLLLHLGMTGQLFGEGASSQRLVRAAERSRATAKAPRFVADEHTHLQLEFVDKGPRVFFRDVRKFGKVLLVGAGQSDARLDKLGIAAERVRITPLDEVFRR